jgi:hypothetical protein
MRMWASPLHSYFIGVFHVLPEVILSACHGMPVAGGAEQVRGLSAVVFIAGLAARRANGSFLERAMSADGYGSVSAPCM